jgi:hypothetical protein
MSWEVGVVASFLLDRVLVVEGNVSPPANLVAYPGQGITNRHPAKIPDLMQIPVPWIEAASVGYDAEAATVLCGARVMDSVFVWPPERDLDTDDFRAFARGRKAVIAHTPTAREAPVVRLCPSSSDGHAGENLGFYSYFFYLDAPTRRVVDQLLRRMEPLPPYAELATRVSRSLGDFNAVHIRRGDFKKTFGTTTLDRTPAEALRVLDRNFRRDQTLVILTDERDDPFFQEITACYSDAVFIDHHILDHHHEAFFDLPFHDSLALAYLSQLVAADALDFVGSMTSTYTSLVQRFRGNRGRPERFKFLWNELPEPGHKVEKRGSHPPSECVPLRPDGSMVDQSAGPYSWNRVYERINPAWQREWPESFLSPAEDRDSVNALLARFQAGLRSARAPSGGGETSRVSDPSAENATVSVTVHLVGGRSVETELAPDSELLKTLFRALATRGEGTTLLQLPLDEGRAAYSFSSDSLLAVETRPPVLIEDAPLRLEGAPEPHPEAPREAPPPEAKAPPEAPAAAQQARRGPPRVHVPPQRPVQEPLRDFEPLPFVQFTDFLTPGEHQRLLEAALACQSSFAPEPGRPSREIAARLDEATAERIARRLRLLVPHLLPAFDLARAIRAEDLVLAAHRDGDAVPAPAPSDGGPDEITCRYFFFKEPRPLSGGELRLRKGENLHLVAPRDNAVLLYPTAALEEIAPVRCPSGAFEDSQFTVSLRIP